MGAKHIINKLLRILLLALAGLALLIYFLGIIANVFGLLEMRRSDEDLLSVLNSSVGTHAIVDKAVYQGGSVSYAGVRSGYGADSVAVIFVHGSPGSLDAYTPYLLDKHLQTHAGLYTYDRLGYGNSTQGSSDLSLIRQSEQLYAFVKHIHAPKTIFVGHSLGCSIIARLAMDHPDVVHGLVMVAAPIDPELEPSSWWRPLLDMPKVRLAMPHAFRISNRELAPLKQDLEACLPLWVNVRCPVTFIHGDKDELVPFENVVFGKRMLQNAKQVSEVVLKDHGHFILWTHVELIADEIVKMME